MGMFTVSVDDSVSAGLSMAFLDLSVKISASSGMKPSCQTPLIAGRMLNF